MPNPGTLDILGWFTGRTGTVDRVRAVVAAVLLAIAISVCCATLPGTHASAAASTGCADGPEAGTPKPASAGVTRTDYTFAHRVDGRCRTLVTQVREPAPASPTTVPVILAIHGLDGTPNALAPLLDGWTRAGYVVVAPTFPKTKKDARGKALRSEVVDQAADARFVLDEVLDRASTFGIDPAEVGAAGMSLGGMTVYGLISHTCCQDGRITAAVVMAGVHDVFPTGRYVHQDVPVLLLQGDADVGLHNSQSAYAQLAPPKWFVTLHGEGHSPPFEVPRGSASALVDTTTALFWNRYLEHDTAAAQQIVDAVAATNGKATLRRDLR
ncbi:MAG TPA: dienelactone hydrolase family protein [Acidimicrobiia bacterium]|jgi:dienelactone hydrolase